MNVTTQIVITNKTDVCPADIAETVDYANRVARKMQYQGQKKKTENLNIYQTRINVQAAEYVPAYVPAVFGKLNGANKKLINNTFNSFIQFEMSIQFKRALFCIF